MSAIPPDIIGSSIQATATQREASRTQDADRAAQSHAAKSQSRAVAEATSNVETTDDDTQVFTDAEGGGSQGRPFQTDEEMPDVEGDDEEATPDGPHPGADPKPHLDIQA